MKHLMIVFYILVALFINPIGVLADNWPKLNGGKQFKLCTEAYQIAKAAFQSDSFYLFTPPVIPEGLESVLVLKPRGVDIVGEDALDTDPSSFDKYSKEDMPRSIYWQKIAKYGYRLVILEMTGSWRGNSYYLITIKEEVKPEEVLTDAFNDIKRSKFKHVIYESWRPPLIFREKLSGEYWIIDAGEPPQFLADWRVYVAGPEGVKLLCSVQFCPKVKNAVSLLPQPVRNLAQLLEQTIGTGENESTGTLNTTARLKCDVEYTWANALLRPWALSTPYNTREEVDAGLKVWSRKGTSYRKACQDIQHQYPLAEQSLAAYYQKNLKRSSRDAKSLATRALDIAFRSHYLFSKQNGEK